VIAVTGRPYQLHVLRLTPGEDVRAVLETWCKDRNIEAAAIVSSVGSLNAVNMRLAGLQDGQLTTGDMEVCCLSGTLSKHGLHLHITVADNTGRTSGGHLLVGSSVRTTLEVVVHELGGVRMLRRHDPDTGYDELLPEPIAP
jgi:predicted DNA-binding protein with PD1-like motif